MRVSVDTNDPGYYGMMPAVCIYLDGVKLDYGVITADEERGLVIVAEIIDGRPRVNHRGIGIRTREMHGKVRIEIPPDSPLGCSLGTQ